jgi:hypothetical protein
MRLQNHGEADFARPHFKTPHNTGRQRLTSVFNKNNS